MVAMDIGEAAGGEKVRGKESTTGGMKKWKARAKSSLNRHRTTREALVVSSSVSHAHELLAPSPLLGPPPTSPNSARWRRIPAEHALQGRK
jgi:hypothetical protein